MGVLPNKEVKIMKKLILLVLCISIIAMPFVSFAAPEFLGANYTGSVDNLVDILNPDSFSTTTSNSVCVVSAAAKSGTTVAIYMYDAATGMYRKINTYFNGVKLEESAVGASGLYARQVLLKEGLNKILVYAQRDGAIQTKRLEVTLLSEAYVGNLRTFISSRLN